jgi:uncharacterized protein YodC (DUF2158 family)
MSSSSEEGHQFVVGDVVELKSGGSHMTVTDPNYVDQLLTEPRIKTVWFEGTKIVEGVFPCYLLQLVKKKNRSIVLRINTSTPVKC